MLVSFVPFIHCDSHCTLCMFLLIKHAWNKDQRNRLTDPLRSSGSVTNKSTNYTRWIPKPAIIWQERFLRQSLRNTKDFYQKLNLCDLHLLKSSCPLKSSFPLTIVGTTMHRNSCCYHPRMRVGDNFTPVCVSDCLSVQVVTFELLQLETLFSVHRYIFTISKLSLGIKFIGSRSKSNESNILKTFIQPWLL